MTLESQREGLGGAPLEAFVAEPHRVAFTALADQQLPRPLKTLRLLILGALLLLVAFLSYTPWVQNAAGDGRVTTLNPAERSQTLTSLASGRLARWHVGDGSYVSQGDPIVDIVDIDPQLVERLTAEQRAVQAAFEAAQEATRTARLNLERQRRLLEQGLTSQVAFERAQILVNELSAKESEAEASLNQARVAVTRQTTQQVVAPRDGTILGIRAGDMGTLVRAGDVIAEFVPKVSNPAIELYISGLDASLVTPGRKARVMFEGWPAVQFGGWPEVAVGTFGAVVSTVDPVVSPNGRFRVLLVADPDDAPWPSNAYLRFGAQARGWILLDTVSVGYELWRRLNGFPPENSAGATPGA